ncbi:DUF3299 domain-containing protein [Psychromonas sp. Urea-02u-13]|uniref:DUF3299 domain-containing protein n=1 Tax=Psychromonas sp. Urea-02u-13 TaxID=2058326 RepID=UPI0012FEF784|nr:DUF3299 domain-containing protein [Psychromonas sp. Urea-02u-13]
MKKLLLIPFFCALFSVAQAAETTAPLKINFTDLQGKVAPYKDPFENLTEDQLYNLSIHARILAWQEAAPEQVTEAMIEESAKAKAFLDEQKIDIAYLFEQRLIIMEKRQQASMVTNDLLKNKNIEIGGYMLALEFDDGLVTEFLLVPTIGACSHKPVPPANQLILVKTDKPIEAGSPYMPIRVTGKLLTTAQQKDLYLVDGQKNIAMSYSIDGAKVEPFLATH